MVTRAYPGIGRRAHGKVARIEGEIIIAAPVEQVFDTLADERSEPLYNPRIIRAQKTSQRPIGRGTRFAAEPWGWVTGGHDRTGRGL